MLIDFEDDPVIYLYKQKSGAADGLGMSINDPVGGVPFPGRISGINSHQILAWATLGFQADAELFTTRDDLESGDVIQDDVGTSYLIQGRSRRVPKGGIHEYYKYALRTQSLS